MIRKLLAILLFCSGVAFAQTHTFPAEDTNNTFTGNNSFNAGAKLGGTTVAALPAPASTPVSTLRNVTDGASGTDCTVGLGTTPVLCYNTGSSWVAIVGASASGCVPGGATGDVQTNNAGLCAGGTQLSVLSHKPATTDNIVYVSPNGNDANDGLSQGTAKKTVSAACTALPSGNSSCTAGNGTIIASPGYSVFLPNGTTPAVSLQIGAAPGGTNTAAVAGNITSGPVPWIDARSFGARAFENAPATITVTTNGTATVTTTGISDFIAGDGIAIPKAGNATAQSTPSAPTVTNIGATGSSTINYKCVGVDQNWGLTAASAAGTTTTAPTVFGAAATAISTISRSSNVVTVVTSTNMPFSSGTFHIMVGAVTGGSTNFRGMYLATVSNATTLTYNQTGADESGTVTAGTSSVIFVNGFLLTTVQATAGSNQLVLTTDVNHNLQDQLSGTHPTKLFLDGINFSGAPIPGYADGLFSVKSVTANTITLITPYVSTSTVTGTASSTQATSGVAQMTVLVWPEQLVTCPAISGTTLYYAVYADYGGGYAPIGFTTWLHNKFLDYGPAFTKTGFTAPLGMNLPATAPGASQNQIFSGQIQSISGTTLTLTASVPGSVTSATAYHDNGIPILNAINSSCQATGSFNPSNNNRTFYPVYLAPTPAAQYYFFYAPVDLSNTSNSCNRISVVDGGALFINGTITASGAPVLWERPEDLAGVNVSPAGSNVKLGVYAFGNASPMMAGSSVGSPWWVRGLVMVPLSNSQNGFVNTGADSRFEDFTCIPNGSALLSSTCFVNAGAQFFTYFHNFNFGGIPNINTPLSPVPGIDGQVMYWPVPSVQSIGGPSNQANIQIDGQNYGDGTGIEVSNLYGSSASQFFLDVTNVQTFQEPWQPLITLEGSTTLQQIRLSKDVMDSITMPVISTVIGGSGGAGAGLLVLDQLGTTGVIHPVVTGQPFSSVIENSWSAGSFPSQNTNETFVGFQGFQQSGPGKFFCNPTTGNTTSTFTAYDNTNTAQFNIACPSGSPSFAQVLNTGTETMPTNTGGIPTAYLCGTIAAAGACANTTVSSTGHIISGIATLSGGTSTITGISPAFTSSTSFFCVTNDVTTIANPSKGVPASGTTVTFTGTGTDNIQFICGGN